MSDVDVLDMLFNGDSSILHCEQQQPLVATTTTSSSSSFGVGCSGGDCGTLTTQHCQSKMFDGLDSDWPSSFLTPSLDAMDHNEFFNALLESNLPDDVKQQQQFTQPPQKQISDHAYSIVSPSSPHSDSGISSSGSGAPYSPNSSSNGLEDLPFDMDQELFGPLDLKSYDDDIVTAGVDPMLLDNFSDCSSNSPALAGNESPIQFDFEELGRHPSQATVQGLTISTDETTKVIKVLSVNGGCRNQALHQLSTKQKPSSSDSPYPELMLSDEEKDLLRKEGINLPSHLPLTREEEKILRSIRRRIRNKASARNSRRKKQDYMEALEKRVKRCTDEKRQLEKKVVDLEKRNSSLIGQLKKLQKLVTDSTRHTAKTGTCAMILALSFALVLLPNYRSLVGSNESSHNTLMEAPCDIAGRPARSLLSKSEDYLSSQPTDKSFNFIPFLNFNAAPFSSMSAAKEPVDDPVDELDSHSHDVIDDMVSIKRGVASSPSNVEEKVIHMEITKLPDEGSAQVTDENQTTHIVREEGVRRRSIKMDLGDEL